MQVARPHGTNTNEPRPPNLYYDQTSNRQTFQPPAGVQTNNKYAPNHNGPATQQPAGNGRQVHPHNPSPTNTQDVRFIESTMEPQVNEPPTVQAMPAECQNQWSPHANAITYELKGVYEGTTHEAPALAVTTRAMRVNTLAVNELEGQNEYSSVVVEPPHFPDLKKVANAARQATKVSARKNEILDDREGSNVIHDLDGRDMDQWEGPGIPLDEFEGVHKPRVEKADGYDLWADHIPLKADITFGQLLEISPMARKTLKEGMPITRQVRKAKTRVTARVQLQGSS